jgi:hypothetical protein
MEIKTKFNLDDKVFFIHQNKVKFGYVNKIFTSVSLKGKGVSFGYILNEDYVIADYFGDTNYIGSEIGKFKAEILFSTKEELIKSL